jgi:hypothetical protein
MAIQLRKRGLSQGSSGIVFILERVCSRLNYRMQRNYGIFGLSGHRWRASPEPALKRGFERG